MLAKGIAHTILATYNGDGNYLGSSATSGINVTVGSLDFTFTATGPRMRRSSQVAPSISRIRSHLSTETIRIP